MKRILFLFMLVQISGQAQGSFLSDLHTAANHLASGTKSFGSAVGRNVLSTAKYTAQATLNQTVNQALGFGGGGWGQGCMPGMPCGIGAIPVLGGSPYGAPYGGYTGRRAVNTPVEEEE